MRKPGGRARKGEIPFGIMLACALLGLVAIVVMLSFAMKAFVFK